MENDNYFCTILIKIAKNSRFQSYAKVGIILAIFRNVDTHHNHVIKK